MLAMLQVTVFPPQSSLIRAVCDGQSQSIDELGGLIRSACFKLAKIQ